MNHYLDDSVYNALLTRLEACFLGAAQSTSTTLRDELAVALAEANVMPRSTAPDPSVLFTRHEDEAAGRAFLAAMAERPIKTQRLTLDIGQGVGGESTP